MIRYKLIWKDIKFLTDEKQIRSASKSTVVNRFPVKYSDDPIFVDILEVDGDWALLKLFYSDGEIVIGWTWHMQTMRPVEIHDFNQLFDGRFNSKNHS